MAAKRAAVAAQEIGHRLAELPKQAAEATTRYRAAAQGAWQSAHDLEPESLRGWSNELGERLGDCPRLARPRPTFRVSACHARLTRVAQRSHAGSTSPPAGFWRSGCGRARSSPAADTRGMGGMGGARNL
jgi:hypothetical protein